MSKQAASKTSVFRNIFASLKLKPLLFFYLNVNNSQLENMFSRSCQRPHSLDTDSIFNRVFPQFFGQLHVHHVSALSSDWFMTLFVTIISFACDNIGGGGGGEKAEGSELHPSPSSCRLPPPPPYFPLSKR